MVTTIQEKKEPLTAKVLDMARLVEYQTGSVVSRAVIQKKTGTVTLFAFDEGQGSERAHGALRCPRVPAGRGGGGHHIRQMRMS